MSDMVFWGTLVQASIRLISASFSFVCLQNSPQTKTHTYTQRQTEATVYPAFRLLVQGSRIVFPKAFHIC